MENLNKEELKNYVVRRFKYYYIKREGVDLRNKETQDIMLTTVYCYNAKISELESLNNEFKLGIDFSKLEDEIVEDMEGAY